MTVYANFMGAYWKLSDAEFKAICDDVFTQPDDGSAVAFEVPEYAELPSRPHVPARRIFNFNHATRCNFEEWCKQ